MSFQENSSECAQARGRAGDRRKRSAARGDGIGILELPVAPRRVTFVNAVSKAHFEFRGENQFNLSLDPEAARVHADIFYV